MNLRNKAGLICALTIASLLLLASVAQAQSPWWNLTSGARPTYIDPNGGQKEIQQLTVSAAAGGYVIICATCEEEGHEELVTVPFNATHEELQELLEGLYGAGNVEVPKGQGDEAGDEPYEIIFTGELAFRPVPPPTTHQFSFLKLTGGREEAAIEELSSGRPAGEVYATLENIGDAATAGSPIKLTDVLPPGLEAVAINATRPGPGGGIGSAGRESIPCDFATLSCESATSLVPFDGIEMRIAVNVEAGTPEGVLAEPNKVKVSGGAAAAASITRPLTLSSRPVPFGFNEYALRHEEEGGSLASRAGSHPFQQTTTITANQLRDQLPISASTPRVEPAALPKDTSFHWPPGLFADPSPFTQCTDPQFETIPAGLEDVTGCPQSSAVGVADVTITTWPIETATFVVPVFNLEPHFGQPARLAFKIVVSNTPIFIEPAVRSGEGEDYGLNVATTNIVQISGFLSATVTVWGDPGDPRHALSRGWGCLGATRGASRQGPCEAPADEHPPAFVSLPTNCTSPLASTLSGDSWSNPFPFDSLPLLASYETPALTACNQIPFHPETESQASADSGETGSGLDFNVDFDDEGLLNGEGLIESQAKKAVVTLPEGLTINPSVGEGLGVCTPAQYRRETLNSAPGEGCPNSSKLGTVEATSPLVDEGVSGSIYLAQEDDKATTTPGAENPFDSLIALYMVLKNPKLGVMVRLPLKVEPNEKTGQLIASLDNIPQLPLEHFNFHFKEGARAPLVTPAACGTYVTRSQFYPWSNPDTPTEVTASFQITRGVNGGPCPPGGVPPFHPHFEAGAINNDAGSFSPFDMRLIRQDGEQDMTKFSAILPPGELGSLAGVAKCPDSAIAIAKSKTGRQELAAPSCPANSLIGHTLAGAGVGEALTYVPGQLYLGGPYHGDPLSVISVTPALAGPFDAGTVVVQLALTLNPKTAEVEVDGANSDPIPHILDGIVLKLRDLRVYVDRKDFTLNPTSCEESKAKAVLFGSNLNVFDPSDDVPVDLSSRYQASNCASLGFKPDLKLNLKGGTKRGGHPGLTATYTPRKGDANIKGLVVRLPRSAFLDQAHIRTICTRVQFAAKACPPGARYGYIKAWTPLLEEPLEGPVYLRSSDHKLPDLVFDLHGLVDIEVDVRIDSAHGGIRATLEDAPDAPLSRVVLRMQGAKKGLIVNSRNLCGSTNRADVEFEGHNGKRSSAKPVMKAQCGGKRAHGQHRRRG
jgi:hypothetical protein